MLFGSGFLDSDPKEARIEADKEVGSVVAIEMRMLVNEMNF